MAVGAFLLSGALIVLVRAGPGAGAAIGAIPPPIARAMLAGVLLPLCLAPVKAVAEVPLLTVPVGPAARAGDRLALSNRLDEPGPTHRATGAASLFDHTAAATARLRVAVRATGQLVAVPAASWARPAAAAVPPTGSAWALTIVTSSRVET